MDRDGSRRDTSIEAREVTWLSGEIVTFINKIGSVIWLAVVAGSFLEIFLKNGRVFIAPGFGLLIAFVLLATVFIGWLSIRIQRVGYVKGHLIVSNYLRQEQIPFDQVETAEPVWWYYRRMVCIRLRSDTTFGRVLYYIPKWAAIKCFWVAPEKELQEVLENDRIDGLLRSEPGGD
jgi:hypothetical protein